MSHGKLSWLGLLLVLSSVSRSISQQKPDPKPTEVTISELGLHPQKYDRSLVTVHAWLVFGWEGDDFLSDPSPQNMPSGSPAYVWFYCKPDHEQKVYEIIQPARRRKVRGWFTGYFHFVSIPQMNGVFSPGHFKLEVVEAPVLEPQPRSLADAIAAGDIEEVRNLIHLGAKLNILDEHQALPLFEAIESHHVDIAKELLANGADPKLPLPDGSTALMAAAWLREPEIARLLLNQGVLANVKTNKGETALMRSSYNGSDGTMVKLLLDAGADPNARTDTGMTALIAAAMAGDAASAEKLLKAGADPAVKDKYGHTAEDDACDRGEKGHYQVCLLVRHALGKN
jgi:hypothetical protein